MTKPNPTSEVADEVPWSDGISEYVVANRSDESSRYSGTGRRHGLIGTLSSWTGSKPAD